MVALVGGLGLARGETEEHSCAEEEVESHGRLGRIASGCLTRTWGSHGPGLSTVERGSFPSGGPEVQARPGNGLPLYPEPGQGNDRSRWPVGIGG